LHDLSTRIGYRFKSPELLRQALTHSSTGAEKNYERLEFLGDRVLGLVVSDILFDKFPDENEGDLAKRLASLVQGAFLAKRAVELDLGTFLNLSDAERTAGGGENDHILADVLEALIGAIYLDSRDLAPCRAFIEKLWGNAFFTMQKPPQHPKTALQEWLQGQGLPLPNYKIAGQSGPDHAPVFEVELKIKGHPVVSASGRSRQEAEKEAARVFMERVE
jgi:ribonuclease-3